MQSNEITLVMVSENVLEAYSLCNTSQYLRFNRVSYDAWKKEKSFSKKYLNKTNSELVSWENVKT